jgi:diphthine synthase
MIIIVMLYLIGLGLNEKGISVGGKEGLKKCKKIYLENYTVEFPYNVKKLEKVVERKIISLGREEVESERLAIEANKEDICLLVYGCPLFATTHMSLLEDCVKHKTKYKIIYASSVFDAIAESGLQLYKFGKVSSMPAWKGNFRPDSFLDFVKENNKIGAHSLILVDIGLKFEDALKQLVKASKSKRVKLEKILVCSRLGVDSRFDYDTLFHLNKKSFKAPFCFVIPSKMHFFEEEVLEGF